ncbi:MAG: methyltransferase domain-containing protein [Planctomycetota bacterium]|nr:MAG: methyltransferase domain-containing protein [Planctomycetota bacterium]
MLDLGCGPGFTSFDLARVVGPTGSVITCDISTRFLAFLRSERDRLALTQIEPSLGSVEDLDLPPGHLDGVYARWLSCWLPDPGAVLERVARGVKRGGAVAIQDYFDWSAMKLVPECATFGPVMDGCMRSWQEGGGMIDVGELIPGLAEHCGLAVEHLRPLARIGCVGSMEWRWLGGFFRSYLPKVVERSLLSADELEAFQAEWDRRSGTGGSWVHTPTMVDVVLRKR